MIEAFSVPPGAFENPAVDVTIRCIESGLVRLRPHTVFELGRWVAAHSKSVLLVDAGGYFIDRHRGAEPGIEVFEVLDSFALDSRPDPRRVEVLLARVEIDDDDMPARWGTSKIPTHPPMRDLSPIFEVAAAPEPEEIDEPDESKCARVLELRRATPLISAYAISKQVGLRFTSVCAVLRDAR